MQLVSPKIKSNQIDNSEIPIPEKSPQIFREWFGLSEASAAFENEVKEELVEAVESGWSFETDDSWGRKLENK